jgi:hypothetical protein
VGDNWPASATFLRRLGLDTVNGDFIQAMEPASSDIGTSRCGLQLVQRDSLTSNEPGTAIRVTKAAEHRHGNGTAQLPLPGHSAFT